MQFHPSAPAWYWTRYSQLSVSGIGWCLWPFHSATENFDGVFLIVEPLSSIGSSVVLPPVRIEEGLAFDAVRLPVVDPVGVVLGIVLVAVLEEISRAEDASTSGAVDVVVFIVDPEDIVGAGGKLELFVDFVLESVVELSLDELLEVLFHDSVLTVAGSLPDPAVVNDVVLPVLLSSPLGRNGGVAADADSVEIRGD